MKFLLWLQACGVVYSRHLAALSGRTRLMIIMCIAAVLVASLLGFAATVFILVVGGLILPLLNNSIKEDIDREYKRK